MSTTTQDVLLSDERLIELANSGAKRDDPSLKHCSAICRYTGSIVARDLYEAERTKLLDLIRQGVEAVERLKQQVELCEFRDPLGHDLRMNAAYLDLITLNLPKP